MADEHQEGNPIGKLMEELQKTHQEMADLKLKIGEMKKYYGAIEQKFKKQEEQTTQTAAAGYKEFAKNINGAVKQLDAGLALNESDRSLLANAESKIKRFNRLFLFLGIITALSLLGLGATLYGANKWYKTSVQSKEEIKQDIFQERKARGLVYVDEKTLNALENERDIIQIWVKDNPKDAKPFVNFRNGIVKAKPNLPVFKSINSEKLR